MRYIIKCKDLCVTNAEWHPIIDTILTGMTLGIGLPEVYDEKRAKLIAEKIQGDLIEI